MVGQVGAKALIAASLRCEEMGRPLGSGASRFASGGRLPGRRPLRALPRGVSIPVATLHALGSRGDRAALPETPRGPGERGAGRHILEVFRVVVVLPCSSYPAQTL